MPTTPITRVPRIPKLVNDQGTRTRRATKKLDVFAARGAIQKQYCLLEFKVRCGFPLTEDLIGLVESFSVLD
jgi:hypothetical protein